MFLHGSCDKIDMVNLIQRKYFTIHDFYIHINTLIKNAMAIVCNSTISHLFSIHDRNITSL